MILTLYHGSENIIEKPVFGKGNPKNDYGLGFYCTKELSLAREWACSGAAPGFANEYKLDVDGLDILNLNSADYDILNWLAILLENRTFDVKTAIASRARSFILENYLPDYRRYDMIVGYRADDSYFSFSRAFLENGITLEQLSRAMNLGNLGEQVVLKSSRSFERITFETAVPSDGNVFYPRRLSRDRKAREDYFAMLAESQGEDELYIADIMRQNR